MNRRDLSRFVDLHGILEEKEKEEEFSFYTEDLADELSFK